MAKDRNAQLRDPIAGYSDSIRLSDIKRTSRFCSSRS
jgi:hypothetical protein